MKQFQGVVVASVAFLTMGPGFAVAQDTKMDHSKMPMPMALPAPAGAANGSATQAFKAANDKMHMEMQVAATGNPDVDFIKNMMPHHQGAIEMAKIELQYGKDPKARKLAQQIIKAQNTEIAFMNAWLARVR